MCNFWRQHGHFDDMSPVCPAAPWLLASSSKPKLKSKSFQGSLDHFPSYCGSSHKSSGGYMGCLVHLAPSSQLLYLQPE